MTVLQVQSLPVLAHQHRSIIFFVILLVVELNGVDLTGWRGYLSFLMMWHLSAICECDSSSVQVSHSTWRNGGRHNDSTTCIINGSLGGVHDTACPRA